MGSYFTHNLISGMRGAADSSGDKLVTLAEAYKYAYDRTVVSTAMLPVGAQHPNYDFRLSGQGELVLSSLLKPSSVLVLPEVGARAGHRPRARSGDRRAGRGSREVALTRASTGCGSSRAARGTAVA